MPTLADKTIRADAEANILGPIRIANDRVHGALTMREEKLVELAGRLRRLREREGVSLREVAARLGLSAAYVSDVELGRRNLLVAFAEKYVAAVLALRQGKGKV